MSQRLQELCQLLVEDSCGSLCSQIFTTLADNGRLSRLQLQQHTRIPGRKLRTAITVLAQQHLILHFTTEDDLTFYQVDWRGAYWLTRSHRIISLVEDRHGKGASRIMANLIQLGHARVGALAGAFDLAPKRDSALERCNVNGEVKVNGTDAHKTSDGTITTVAQFHSTLRALLRTGFLIKLNKKSYMPHADLQHEFEERVIADQFPDRKVNGPRKQKEYKMAINTLKRKWRSESEYSEQRDADSRGVIRRPGMKPNKRAKTHGGLTNGIGHSYDEGDDEDVSKLPNDMVLKVNYPQCAVALRSQRLEELAEPYLGGVTAHVYGALLQVLEQKIRARDDNIKLEKIAPEKNDPEPEHDDDDDDDVHVPTATTMEIAEILDPTIDLTLGILGAADSYRLTNRDIKHKRRTKEILDPEFAEIGIKQEISDDDDANGFTSYHDQSKRLSLIEEHLKILEEHSKSFCRKSGGGGHGEWKVDFSSLTDTLVQAGIDSTILSRFGKAHCRIIRLLRERGRLDEKQIAAYAMMRKKDVCVILTELQYAGFAEPQEVPKDTTRQNARTYYLWFHDQSRVQSLLVSQTYQTMSRFAQRLKQERENYKNAIEKAEMMDVKQEALNQNEREAVMQWREVEEKLLGQVLRLDDMVALMRDFSGKDTSLVS